MTDAITAVTGVKAVNHHSVDDSVLVPFHHVPVIVIRFILGHILVRMCGDGSLILTFLGQ